MGFLAPRTDFVYRVSFACRTTDRNHPAIWVTDQPRIGDYVASGTAMDIPSDTRANSDAT